MPKQNDTKSVLNGEHRFNRQGLKEMKVQSQKIPVPALQSSSFSSSSAYVGNITHSSKNRTALTSFKKRVNNDIIPNENEFDLALPVAHLENKIGGFYLIPYELVLKIFKELTIFDLAKCSQVCQMWNNCIKTSRILWSNINLESVSHKLIGNSLEIIARNAGSKMTSFRLGYAPKLNNLKPLIKYHCDRIDIFEISENRTVSSGSFNEVFHRLGQRMTQLRLKDVRGIDDTVISVILRYCKSLKILDLSGNIQLTQSAFRDLTSSNTQEIKKSLKELILSNCPGLSNNTIIYLCNLQGIEIIDIRKCNGISRRGLQNMQSWRNLQQFFITGTSLTEPTSIPLDDILINLTNNWPNLTHLEVSFCPFLTDEIIISITEHCQKLENINFSSSAHLSDRSLESLQTCTNLNTVILSRCPKITDAGFIQLASMCHNLIHINLSFTRITDNAVLSFSSNCKSLSVISIAGCSNITGTAVLSLVRNLKELKSLILDYCHRVGADVIQEAKAKLGSGCSAQFG